MGTSRPNYLQELGNFIIETQPKTILDIGVGFGKNGYLIREYTDIWNQRVRPEEWTTVIDGIEVYESYVHRATNFIYNSILIEEATSVIGNIISNYELAIMTDVLEHFDKEKGLFMLEQMSKCPHLFVTTPLNPRPQGEVNGNVYETHRSKFSFKELSNYGEVLSKDSDNILILYK